MTSTTTSRFQLTRPLRGVTDCRYSTNSRPAISTHTPLAGRDVGEINALLPSAKFQLTRPLRGVTAGRMVQVRNMPEFQLTRPLRGVTQ